MKRKLKLFNGRLRYDKREGHGYIAAYSAEDAIRVLDQTIGGRGNRTEIKVYWSHGLWGKPMDGIHPERGLWFIGDWPRGIPERIKFNAS
jgi:hypothetical protein